VSMCLSRLLAADSISMVNKGEYISAKAADAAKLLSLNKHVLSHAEHLINPNPI